MIGRKFGMDVENLVKEKSSNHIVLKSRSYSFDNKTKPPSHITRRISIANERPPSLNMSRPPPTTAIITEKEGLDLKGMQCVPDYYKECIKHMMSKEKCHKSMYSEMQIKNPKYCSKRAQIIQWMVNIHTHLKLFPETLFIAVNYMDEFASKTQMISGEEEIVPLACILMAGKFQQTYRIPSIKHLVQCSEIPLNKENIILMEQKILDSLGFDLITQIPIRYLDLFSKIIGLSPKNRFIAQYILELALIDPTLLQFSPSLMGSSVVYLVNKIRKLSPAWPEELVELTGLEQSSLKHCAKQLCSLLERSHEIKFGGAIRKKFSRTEYFEASKIRLQRKTQ